ncbi:hypothetical protein BDK51DRAFT_45385 [Blyttiomyces helicus]|uniref:Uncharacterized protein n=1 Tax=Blyttiomyces helicus TaxID=388810 RepID=A0A4P9WGY1_9FUNG|nr:hypothetical protein BDK51DRAFT_45385 [Blyttiomyces helicus]|eukprot:RKO91093.1 hypothetical protein BDK51DRAFT_45385 [Blyttiomyces helicus]
MGVHKATAERMGGPPLDGASSVSGTNLRSASGEFQGHPEVEARLAKGPAAQGVAGATTSSALRELVVQVYGLGSPIAARNAPDKEDGERQSVLQTPTPNTLARPMSERLGTGTTGTFEFQVRDSGASDKISPCKVCPPLSLFNRLLTESLSSTTRWSLRPFTVFDLGHTLAPHMHCATLPPWNEDENAIILLSRGGQRTDFR